MRRILVKAREKFLDKNSPVFTISILFLLTLVSYGQTLFMYFLIDDNALIYKLLHFDQNLGLWGKGFFGEGPYRHIVDQFIPFFPIFGINPVPYFSVGLLLYFFTSVILYFFFKFLTKSKLIAFSAASIFASGFVGSETMFGIVNSWQTPRGLIMAVFTFWLFYKYIQSKNTMFYFLSVFLFFFALDTVYIRAHGLIFAIFFFDLLFWPVAFKLLPLSGFILRQLPFLFIHFYIYLSSVAYAREFGIFRLLHGIFIEGKLVLATIPIQDIGNLLIPDFFSKILDRFVSKYFFLPVEFSFGSFLAGIFVCIFSIYVIIKNFKKENFLVRVILFSFIFSIANFIVFWLRETGHTLWTTHRYFFYSFAGVSLFWATSFYLISKQFKKENLLRFLTIMVVVIYLLLGVSYQREFNQRRSFPAKKFFSSFEQAIPDIPKGAVIYFDLMNDNQIKGEFGSFFGGIFSEGSNLAIYSPHIDYMNDFTFTYKFEDVLKALQERKVSINNVFSFYYSNKGLINTTADTRNLLKNNKITTLDAYLKSTTKSQNIGNNFITSPIYSTKENVTFVNYPKIIFEINGQIPSLIPSTLTLSMRITPKLLNIPFQSYNQTYQISPNQKRKIFDYLSSQQEYLRTASASAASFWKEQEPKFAIDTRLETSWRGHRGFWDEIYKKHITDKEFFELDLKKVKRVSQIIWVTAQTPLIPTDYSILTSLDGISWNLVKSVHKIRNLPHSSVVIDTFEPTDARFIKMEIYKTIGNDGPEIEEFEVIEEQYANLDRDLIRKVGEEPFSEIETVEDYNDALSYVLASSNLRFYFRSDADSNQDPIKYFELPIKIDGMYHEYLLNLPASGMKWVTFTIEGLNFPAEILLKSPIFEYQYIK